MFGLALEVEGMTDDSTSIGRIKEEIGCFIRSRGWGQAHSPKNLVMSISIEAAELMEILQWKTTEQSWRVRETGEFARLREEIADVLIYCFSLANQLDMDLTSAIADKMQSNAARFPAERIEP